MEHVIISDKLLSIVFDCDCKFQYISEGNYIAFTCIEKSEILNDLIFIRNMDYCENTKYLWINLDAFIRQAKRHFAQNKKT